MRSIAYLCIILSAGLASACSNNQQQGQQSSSPAKIAIHNNSVNIAYTDTGKNDTTLLFVHGWAINKGYWANQIKYFGKRYRVVAMDLAGFGNSGKNRDKWDVYAFASDVDSVIKELDLKKVILIGHSMSGDIVLQSAIDNKDRVIGLVGIDNFKNPGYQLTEKDKKEYEAAMAQMKQHFVKTATDYFNQALFYKTTTQAVRNRVLNDVAHADSVIAIASMANTVNFDELPKLKQAGKKLYVIGSDVTPVDTTHMVAEKIPFKIYNIHATGHYPMIEKPDDFNLLLDKVIQQL
ncbi:alpha/beta hydrolase [Mucilaginibacter mali]|uniref:Alpha/beta hydrolase n=1 Tax=Mucilaginibacter mali TaxID=2740462 RepID=A0A7D4QBB3_9SPHI|nr:alpha/beta hydrolase [Mucilaginibacter mali]QKJ32551.1 alpha/beta hydrolase [Mucilaginibacter mali]